MRASLRLFLHTDRVSRSTTQLRKQERTAVLGAGASPHSLIETPVFASPASGQFAVLDDVSPGVSPNLFAASKGVVRDSHRMSKLELHELRDYLVKTSVSSQLESPMSMSVHKIPPLGASVGPRQSHFLNASSYLDEATPLDNALSSSRSVFRQSHVVNVIAYPDKTAKSIDTAAMLPRESVAVLIDAVRGSMLPDTEKTKFLFDLFDTNGVGVLSREGVTEFIEATFLASNLKTYGSLHVRDIVARLFARTANPECMTSHEFEATFRDVVCETDESVTDLSATQTSQETTKPKKGRLARLKKKYKTHQSEVLWLTLYFAIMIGAFWTKAYYVHYDPAVGYCAKIAKGFAQVCMVDTLFLLFPMCRNVVAFLRKFAEVSSRVPVDQNIEFHKICGVVMLIASLGHTVAWVFIVYCLKTVPYDVWETSRFARLAFVREDSVWELVPRIPIWTGVVMVLIAAIAAPLTLSRVRRGSFNAFWVTHLMFVPFLVLILVHGLAMWVQPPQAYFWVLPPILLYLVERRYRIKSSRIGSTTILRVKFSQDTVAIYLDKPRNFHYHPGMYLFVKVPIISTYEWHPFTISSAPEDDFLSLHIRNAGDWTGMLHAVICHALQRQGAGIEGGPGTSTVFPAILIDGPVGAPSQDYYRYESVVFVGAGIGVTPFASILQSIMHQWDAYRCDDCNKVKLPKTFKLKKIYFYWITREQEALTWFAETMNQLSAMDTDNRLEIHNYYSPLKQASVIAPLHALQKFIHGTDGRDIISGLSTKQLTHFGRPDWQTELQRIAAQQPGVGSRDVGVFFCGPKPMGDQILSDCAAFNHGKTHDVVFDFHSENF